MTANPRPRSYVVGLPVIVTVGPDGHLIVSVDASEMASAIWEDTRSEDLYDEDEVRADDEAIAAALAAGRYHVGIEPMGGGDEPFTPPTVGNGNDS